MKLDDKLRRYKLNQLVKLAIEPFVAPAAQPVPILGALAGQRPEGTILLPSAPLAGSQERPAAS